MKRCLALAATTCLAATALAGEADAERPKPAEPDAPAVEPAAPAETTDTISNAVSVADELEKVARGLRKSGRGRHQTAVVVFGKDALVKSNETADAVVAIGGNATVHGIVRDAVVAIGGDVEVTGEVGQAVVAVLGSVKVGSNAVIKGDAVAVGGNVEQEEGATIHGEVVPVDFGAFGLPSLKWLRDWFVHCALMLRPLAPQVGWVWVVAGIFFLFYLLVALVLHKPVAACVGELTRRPATTFFIAILTKLLLPLVIVILAATGIGVFVIPFLLAALFFGAIIGKVAFLEFLGQSVGRALGTDTLARPLIAFLAGSALVTLLYLVPILGLVVFAITGLWGLGAAVMAAFGGLRREAPEKPAAPAPMPTAASTPGPAPLAATVAGLSAQGFAVNPGAGDAFAGQAVGGAGEGGFAAQPPGSIPVPPVAVAATIEALAYPRAGFWERMGAAFLDMVLVGILGGIVGGSPQMFLVWLAYFAGMWAWKGTTVGGIVLNLRVVRLDGGPVTFVVALVRGLAAAFSMIVFFLGFLWMIWDREKQTWHDKIAGTVVIRLPRGTPLVCL